MPRTSRVAPNNKTLYYLALKRETKAFDLANAVFLRGSFELVQCRDAEFLINLYHLVRPQPRNREHLEHPFRNLRAHLLKGRMVSGLRKLGDDVRNGIADAGDFLQAFVLDQALDRFGLRGKALRRA